MGAFVWAYDQNDPRDFAGDTQAMPMPFVYDDPAPRTAPPVWNPPPRPPRRRLPRSQTGGIIAGILSAVALMGLLGAAIKLGNNGVGPLAAVFATPRPAPATSVTPPPGATVAPSPGATSTAGAQPTDTATATDTPGATDTPTPSPGATGFTTYASADGVWSIGYPTGAQTTSSSLTVAGVSVPDVEFDFGQGDSVTVYDSPVAVAASDSQLIIDAITQATGATNVTTVQSPTPVTIGANDWTQTIFTATINGQNVEVSVLYATHGSDGFAIASVAPVGTYVDDAAQYFTPMEQSFTFNS